MKLAVLLSGRGSNFIAIYKAIQDGKIPNAVLCCVISNKENAGGLKYAEANGIHAFYVNPKNFDSRDAYDRRLLEILEAEKVDLVCLAGYMRLVTTVLTDAYVGRMMNVHPSLLPAFPGLNPHKQALDYGAKISGCTVHFVDSGLDSGPIILQQSVPVYDNDTVETLSERILYEEHKLYSQAVALFAAGKLRIDGRVVKCVDC